MSFARTLSLLLAGTCCGMLAGASVHAQTVAANSGQQASLSVNPSAQDYVALPSVKPAVPPKDPVALAAFHVLETHCARCHEADRLVGRTKPAKGFGNILHMDEVAANTKYVKPGDPNRSTLYWTVFRKEMPSDMNDGDPTLATFPNDADMKALRDWIVTLDKPPAAMVASLTPPTSDWQAPKGAELPHFPDNPVPAKPVAEQPVAEKPVAVQPAALESAASEPVALVPVPAPLPEQAAEQPAPQSSTQMASLSQDDQTGLGAPGARDPGPGLNFSAPAGKDLVWKTQDRLKALGCYEGQVNGIEDSQTDAALARYNTKLGRGTAVAALSTDLLEELMSQVGRICTPFCPPGTSLDGLQCVPDPDAGQIDRRRAPSSIGESDDEAPRHRRKKVSPPSDVAHAPEPRHSHQAEKPEPRRPHQAERAPEPQHAPPRKSAHANDSYLRQPSYRHAQSRPAPHAHEASRGSSGGGGGGGGGGGSSGGGASTVSGMSGI